jgi:hypothetical protein
MNEETDTSSFVDESLDEFLRKQGIIRGSRYTGDDEELNISASVDASNADIDIDISRELVNSIDEDDSPVAIHDANLERPALFECDILLPSCAQLKKTLAEFGYAGSQIEAKDINLAQRLEKYFTLQRVSLLSAQLSYSFIRCTFTERLPSMPSTIGLKASYCL